MHRQQKNHINSGFSTIVAQNTAPKTKRMSRFVTHLFGLLPIVTPFLIMGVPGTVGAFSFIDRLFAQNDPALMMTAPADLATLTPVLNVNPVAKSEPVMQVEASALIALAGPLGTGVEIDESESSGNTLSVYVVKEGDTLSEIAELFDVSVNTILWANDLKSAKSIKEGDTLVILPVSGVRHTVVKGDTVDSIAKKYKGAVEDILGYNHISTSTTLTVGTVVTIPDGVLPSAPTITPTKTTTKYASLPSVSGFMRPVSGGRRTQGIHGRNAVDLANKLGSPIYAMADGTVTVSRIAGWNTGYGQYIIISHANGVQSLYAHLSGNLVKSGQKVTAGQQIGLMGSTGNSTGSHLHFEVHGARNPF